MEDNKTPICRFMETPDGTVLRSRHRHDYRVHQDSNGEEYMLDGGLDYIRCSVNKEVATITTIYEEDAISLIREHWDWGSYGPNGDQPLHYIKLKDIEEGHMEAISKNCTKRWCSLFDRELEYRRGLEDR